MKVSPTARTLKALRLWGYEAGVVERRLPRGRTTVDLFGAFDVLGVKADTPGVIGIQCTSASNVAARVTKLRACPVIPVWLRAGNQAEVWGFSKRPLGRGGRPIWTLKRRIFYLTADGEVLVYEGD